MKCKIGLFGVAVHCVASLWVLFTAVTGGGAEYRDYLSVLPMVIVSAFVVYAVIVSSYVVMSAGVRCTEIGGFRSVLQEGTMRTYDKRGGGRPEERGWQ